MSEHLNVEPRLSQITINVIPRKLVSLPSNKTT